MNWLLGTSLVHQGSYRVGSTNGEEYSVPQVGRPDAPLLMIRADGIPLDGQNAQLCDEVFWAATEDIHILPHHCVDLGVAGASAAVLLQNLYSRVSNHLETLETRFKKETFQENISLTDKHICMK